MNKQFVKKLTEFVHILKETPSKWTKEQVLIWFEEVLHFHEYNSILKKKKINGTKLVKIVEGKKFEKLGIIKIGHKKLIEQQIRLMIEKFLFSPQKEENLLEKKIMWSDPTGYPLSPRNQSYQNTNKYHTEDIQNNCTNWSNKEVSNWLKKNCLEELIEIFEFHKIRGDILLDVDEIALKLMGIDSLGIIKKFQKKLFEINPSYFLRMKETESNYIIPTKIFNNSFLKVEKPWKWSSFQISQWLHSIGFGSYSQIFIDNEIVNNTFCSLGESDLKELGITSTCDRIKILEELKSLQHNHRPPPLKMMASTLSILNESTKKKKKSFFK